MTRSALPVLLDFFRCRGDYAAVLDSPSRVALLIRQARLANLLPRVARDLQEAQWLQRLEPPARQHLENALVVGASHRRAALWEVREVARALKGRDLPICLLKGCAYAHVGHPAAAGRLFGDIDILVPADRIRDAEGILIDCGWFPAKQDAYDQRYYRDWMHEIPPLRHVRRQTTLDVHHTIVPPIARSGFHIGPFWDEAVADRDYPFLHTLSLRDMILHSAAHLFQEGEFDNGLRDLVDLATLFADFSARGGDWPALLERAQRLDLSVHLYYAMMLCEELLWLDVAPETMDAAARQADVTGLKRDMMRWLYTASLIPDHETCRARGAAVARYLLFVRSHWIRMPARYLVPHLVRKAVRSDT
jgi:hypothetical protein